MNTLPLFTPIVDTKVLNTVVRRYAAILAVGHHLERDVEGFVVCMIPAIAMLIRKQLELFEAVRFELVLGISFEWIEFHQRVNFQAKTDHPVFNLNEIDDVIKNILQSYDHFKTDENCFGWNFERCSNLELSIFQYPHHKTETSSLADLALLVTNRLPRVYAQTCNAMPRDVQRCYGVKPEFLLKELKDVMDISVTCRRPYAWYHFTLSMTPSSSDIQQAAKDVYAARRLVSSVQSTSRIMRLGADVTVCHARSVGNWKHSRLVEC